MIALERDDSSPFPWADLALEGDVESLSAQMPALAAEERYRALLRDNRGRDAAAGRTLIGPHVADLLVRHGPKGAPAAQASTGEQKALLVGLVLAHARLVAAMSGMAPLALLDEVAAHFDPRRRAALFEALGADRRAGVPDRRRPRRLRRSCRARAGSRGYAGPRRAARMRSALRRAEARAADCVGGSGLPGGPKRGRLAKAAQDCARLAPPNALGGKSMWRRFSFALLIAGLAMPVAASAADSQIERGKYLVTISGCGDCHTPGTFLGHPDMARLLGGSDVGFAIPGVGVFVGRNLTPDKETGLGNWTTAQIITAFTTGVRPDGRVLAPVMPWPALSKLTKADAEAIAAYLQSIPAVRNAVPGPFRANEKPSVLVYAIIPGDVYAAMPKPPTK